MSKFTNFTKLTSSYRFRLIISAFNKWLKKKEKVLDVGCGNGIITKLLRNYLGINIVGCDVKNYLIYKDIPFVKIESEKLPFSTKKFDAVLLLDVLHHIPFEKQGSLIQESLRVANKVFIFEAKSTIIAKLSDLILNKYHYGDLNAPLSFRNADEWNDLFKKLSLKAQMVILDKPIWYPFSHIAFLVRKS